MFSKIFVAVGAVAISSLTYFADKQPTSLRAAEPTAQVSPGTYDSDFLTFRPADRNSVSASEPGAQSLNHSGHAQAPTAADPVVAAVAGHGHRHVRWRNQEGR